jgi:hypothetical protein
MVVETDPDPGAGGLRRRVGAMLSYEQDMLPCLVAQNTLYLS